MTHGNSAEVVVTLNMLRENVHTAGTWSGGVWHYPPTVLDEDGRLWGSYADHLDRMLENRKIVRLYYRSLQPDAPTPLLGWASHVAVVEAFVAVRLEFYRPLLSVVDRLRSDLAAQVVLLVSEFNVLYNVVLAMRPLALSHSLQGSGNDDNETTSVR